MRSRSNAAERRSTGFGTTPVVIAYIALISLIPSRMIIPGFGAAGRPGVLFAVGMFLWWVLLSLLSGRTRFEAFDCDPVTLRRRNVAIRLAVYAYLVAFLMAMVAGLDRGLPRIEASAMDRALLIALGFAGVILTLTDGLTSTASVRRVMVWMVWLGAVGAAVGIVQFIGGPDLSSLVRIPGLINHSDALGFRVRGSDGFVRVRGFATHPIEYGVVTATLLPIAIHMATTGRGRWRWIPVILIGASVPLSVSRSGVVAVIVAMLVYALGWSWRTRANALVIAIVAIVAFQAVVPGLLGTLRSLFVGSSNDNSITGRTEDFEATSTFTSQRPWFGRGPGTFIPDRYRVLDNEYLGTLIDSGIVGLASLIALLTIAALTGLRTARRSSDPEVRGLSRASTAGAVGAIVVFATFDALAFPMYAGIVMLNIGCIGALRRIDRSLSVERDVMTDDGANRPENTTASDTVLSESSRPIRVDSPSV